MWFYLSALIRSPESTGIIFDIKCDKYIKNDNI